MGTPLQKPLPMWLKEGREERKRGRKLARGRDVEIAHEASGLLKRRQKLKERDKKEENQEVEVVYLKHHFAIKWL